MNSNKHLIFGVNINGVKHPLRFKTYYDNEALIKTICDWLPIIVLRANSGGVNAGYKVSLLPYSYNDVHVVYWYDETKFYYVEVVEELGKDFFVPSPAVASFYDELDKAPMTLSAAASFNALWASVREQERVEQATVNAHKARLFDELLERQHIMKSSRYQRR